MTDFRISPALTSALPVSLLLLPEANVNVHIPKKLPSGRSVRVSHGISLIAMTHAIACGYARTCRHLRCLRRQASSLDQYDHEQFRPDRSFEAAEQVT